MIEVLWHGRGGQGAFTAARLLGAAASLSEGRYALAFPSFGPERRGAPMRAFTKMDDAPIGDRSAVARADYVVYLDETLLGSGWEHELKPGGRVLVNSAAAFDDERILAIDADGISASFLGRPIPNTVFLGAIAGLCDRVSLQDVGEAIRQYMPEKLHGKNLAIVEEALRRMADASDAVATGEMAAAGIAVESDEGDLRAEDLESAEGLGSSSLESPVRPPARICTLRSGDALDPAVFARTTCFEAGYLTAKNAGWRNVRPVIDAAACTGCLQCYWLCPDGTVFKVDQVEPTGAPVAIDLDFCKGCGVCAKACKFDAIAMIPESEADAR